MSDEQPVLSEANVNQTSRPSRLRITDLTIANLVGVPFRSTCNVDKIFRLIKQFGFHARPPGGVCGIEMALMDLAGKAYGVPAYALVGGQFRDRIRCYADTPSEQDPARLAERVQGRRDRGYTMLKMDIGIDLVAEVPPRPRSSPTASSRCPTRPAWGSRTSTWRRSPSTWILKPRCCSRTPVPGTPSTPTIGCGADLLDHDHQGQSVVRLISSR